VVGGKNNRIIVLYPQISRKYVITFSCTGERKSKKGDQGGRESPLARGKRGVILGGVSCRGWLGGSIRKGLSCVWGKEGGNRQSRRVVSCIHEEKEGKKEKRIICLYEDRGRDAR